MRPCHAINVLMTRPRRWVIFFTMSFAEVLAELPSLTVAERQLLVRRALDLDEPALSAEAEAMLEKRLTEHRRNPESAVPLDEMKTRLRSSPLIHPWNP